MTPQLLDSLTYIQGAESLQIFYLPVVIIYCASLLSFVASNAQTIRYVKPIASGTANGDSWANASAGIQDMLDISIAGDEVWVAAGTYLPAREPDGTIDSPRDFTYYIRNGIKMYGGFAGNETTVTQRISGTNITSLSGNVGDINDFTDNSYHVVLFVKDDATTLIDGFNVVYGNANGTDSIIVNGIAIFRNRGACIYNYASSPVIYDVECSGGANYAGGIYNNSSSPTITNSRISNCSALYNAGGMWNDSSSSPIISNTFFEHNTAEVSACAIYNSFSSPSISDTYFIRI